MKELYPLKFNTIPKEKIWGGKKLTNLLNKDFDEDINIGESWEISGVKENISIVKNGFLANNSLQDIIEIYMGDIVGDRIYNQFGIEFPLLIKFIDATDVLSVQVHPDDQLAKKRHNAYGKTEMWYVLQSDQRAEIITGFKKEISKEKYLNALKNNNIKELLNIEISQPGDVFYIPAGRVHAIGAGNLLTEIQQTSDVTYRIYDWDRKDKNGKSRELHTDLAIDAINFKDCDNYKTKYKVTKNKPSTIIESDKFVTNMLSLSKSIHRDYHLLDSFVILICTEGKFNIAYENNQKISFEKGETLLIPAVLEKIDIETIENGKILEVYYPLDHSL